MEYEKGARKFIRRDAGHEDWVPAPGSLVQPKALGKLHRSVDRMFPSSRLRGLTNPRVGREDHPDQKNRDERALPDSKD